MVLKLVEIFILNYKNCVITLGRLILHNLKLFYYFSVEVLYTRVLPPTSSNLPIKYLHVNYTFTPAENEMLYLLN
jgi:hypothetical protein